MSTQFYRDPKKNIARDLIDNFERIIRSFIEEELNKYYHENWWESGIPQLIRNRVSDQLHNKNKREPKKTFKKIEECTFNDYESIVFNNRNWDKVFKKTFHEKSFIRYPLKQLRHLRNDLSHGRKLSNKDYRKINIYIDDILRYIPTEITLEDLVDINEDKRDVTENFLSYFKENIENKVKIRQTKPSIVKSLNDDDDEIILSKKKLTIPQINTPLRHKIQTSPPTRNITLTTKPIITTERILKVLSTEWQTIKHLIFKLKIKDMMDARYLQLKLKELERKKQVLVEVKMGRKHWKLNKILVM